MFYVCFQCNQETFSPHKDEIWPLKVKSCKARLNIDSEAVGREISPVGEAGRPRGKPRKETLPDLLPKTFLRQGVVGVRGRTSYNLSWISCEYYLKEHWK